MYNHTVGELAGPDYTRAMDVDYPAPEEGDLDCPYDHRIRISSKLAGDRVGVVKNSLFAVVRLSIHGFGAVEFLQYINCVSEDWRNVRENGRRHQVGMICMALTVIVEEHFPLLAREIRTLSSIAKRLNEAVDKVLLLITASVVAYVVLEHRPRLPLQLLIVRSQLVNG